MPIASQYKRRDRRSVPSIGPFPAAPSFLSQESSQAINHTFQRFCHPEKLVQLQNITLCLSSFWISVYWYLLCRRLTVQHPNSYQQMARQDAQE